MESRLGGTKVFDRLSQLKGEMKIESDNTGTRILVLIPVSKSAAAEDEPTAKSL